MFIVNNQAFVCTHCGTHVKAHPTSSRNHCTQCLYSLHVDIDPGDRKHDCHGLMRPVGIEIAQGETDIVYECTICGVVRRNRAAPDDNQELLIELSSKPIDRSYYERLSK